jgi:hypothetical protein
MPQYILVMGSLVNNHGIVGPFEDLKEAKKYAKKYCVLSPNSCWDIVKLEDPDEIRKELEDDDR